MAFSFDSRIRYSEVDSSCRLSLTGLTNYKKNDKGKWSKPEAIGTGLNTDYEEGACCFTPDGKLEIIPVLPGSSAL